MKDKIICLAIGILVATAGATFAQSFTEFLNVRVLEDTELEGDADIQGELSDSTDSAIDLAPSTDLTIPSGNATVGGGVATVSSSPTVLFGESDTGDSWAWTMDDSDIELSFNSGSSIPLTFDIGGDPDTALFSSPWDVEIEEDLSVGTNLNVTGASNLDNVSIDGFVSSADSNPIVINDPVNADEINADLLRSGSIFDEKLRLTQTDAAMDEEDWSYAVNNDGNLFSYARADDGTVGDSWFNVGRTGTTVDSVSFPNGAVTIGDSLSWGGGSAISTSDDVVTGTGGTLSLFDLNDVAADPDADRYAFWDDSAGQMVWDSLIDDTFLSSNVALYDRTTSNFTGTLQYGGTEVSTVDASTLTTGTLANARLDQQLQDVAGLGVADGNFIVGDGVNFVAESGATARASIGANDASNLTTGTLPDARLSSNVPLLDQNNTWTGTNQTFEQGTGVRLDIRTDVSGFTIFRVNSDTTKDFLFDQSNDRWQSDVGLSAQGLMQAVGGLSVGGGQTISDSDNVALLDQNNVFTGAEQTISATSTRLALVETDQGTDEKNWWINLLNGDFRIRTRTDAGDVGEDVLQASRTGTTVDTVNFPDGELQYGGTEVATQESGSFSVDWTDACTTTESQTVEWSRSGGIVTFTMANNVDCTSDSTAFETASGEVPSSLRPDSAQQVPIQRFTDDASVGRACLGIQTDGSLGVNNCRNTLDPWTASGSKSFAGGQSATYQLHN